MGIELMVAIPGVASFAPDDRYNFDRLSTMTATIPIRCPEGRSIAHQW